MAVASGSLPCAIEVTGSGGSPVYHSAVAGSGSGPFTVNASPLTELVTAQAGGVSPATLFSEFTTRSAAITSTSLASGVTYVQTALKSVVDLTGVNPLSDTLVAANGTTAGNALDTKIDAVVAQLATAQTTLAQVVTAVITNPTAPDTLTAVVQTAAADCSRFRSGKYRMINPMEPDPLWRAHVLKIDVTALSATTFNGETVKFVSNGAGLCSYTVTGKDANGTVTETHKFTVSSSGILVVYSTSASNGSHWLTIGLPEQTLALSELAGTYNRLAFGTSNPLLPSAVFQGTGSLDAAGHDTGGSECVDILPCVAYQPPYDTLAADTTNGGFVLTQANDGRQWRIFAFKGANGTAVAIGIATNDKATDPSFIVFTTAKKQTLPTLPFTNSTWNFQVNANHTVAALAENTYVYNSVDTATRIVTRTRDDGLVDSMTYDTPRDGMRYRANNSCSKNGAAQNCAGLIQMPLQGLGITLYGSLSTSASPFFGMGVTKP
mgnify:CR=1 FL=1